MTDSPRTEPQTDEGRALVEAVLSADPRKWPDGTPWELARRVRRIEKQATQAARAEIAEKAELDVEARAGIFPNGYGCNQCDGTGFVSDEFLDRLEERGMPIREIIARNEAARLIEGGPDDR